MSYVKLPVWAGAVHIGCLNCSPVYANTPLCRLDRVLSVGFGDVTITKDGEVLYSELAHAQQGGWEDPLGMTDDELEAAVAALDGEDVVEDFPTLDTYELIAASDPDHDWRMRFWTPLHEEEYQRQGPEAWVLVFSGMGFA